MNLAREIKNLLLYQKIGPSRKKYWGLERIENTFDNYTDNLIGTIKVKIDIDSVFNMLFKDAERFIGIRKMETENPIEVKSLLRKVEKYKMKYDKRVVGIFERYAGKKDIRNDDNVNKNYLDVLYYLQDKEKVALMYKVRIDWKTVFATQTITT